ncbi:hypothetical protein ES705_41279 [subsurface metagenome]
MKLYHLTRGTGKRNWGLFEPERISTGEAKGKVEADLVNFAEFIAEWTLKTAPLLKAAGYSPDQIGKMTEAAFFTRYQVLGFDPVTGVADVVLRAKTAFDPRPDEPPAILTGKVVVFTAVIVAIVVWYLFASHDETAEVIPPLDLYLITYKENGWYAVIIAHTPGDKYHYELAFWPGFTMSSWIREIEAREGTYDRMVFLGTHFEVVAGTVFWHWYNWDFFDVDFVGFLTRKSETLFVLQEGYEDRFAPEKPWFSTGPERFPPPPILRYTPTFF